MRTVDRTLEIFEAFAEAKRPLSLSELARMINMPVSSCHGLLRTLQKAATCLRSRYAGAITRRGDSFRSVRRLPRMTRLLID